MSLNATAIVSLAAAKDRLKETGTTNDTTIEQMIENFTRLIELEVRGPVRQRTVTDFRFGGNGCREITLPRACVPLITIAKLEIRQESDDSVIASLTSASDWIIKDLATGRVFLTAQSFACGENNILFTGSVGYASSDLKYRLYEEACYIALDDYYRRWERRELSVVTKSYPDGSATLIPAASLPPIVRQMLQASQPRRPMVG